MVEREYCAFAKAAFGVSTDWEDRISRYRQSTEVRSKEFENHFRDLVINDVGKKKRPREPQRQRRTQRET